MFFPLIKISPKFTSITRILALVTPLWYHFISSSCCMLGKNTETNPTFNWFNERTEKNWGTWKKIIQPKRTSKIQASAMQPLKTLKPFEITWHLRKQPSNLRMLLVRSQEKNFRICCFQKTLWLDDLLPSAPVAVNPPWCSNTEFNGLDNLVPRSPTAKGKQSEIWVRD